MTKRKTDPALEELAALSKLGDDEKIRRIRELERQMITAKADRRALEAKYMQSETELMQSEASIARLLATQDAVTVQKITKCSKRPGKGQASAIICVNDWHCEENVDPAVVNGLNEFNPTIAEKRIRTTWEKAVYLIEFARQISDINEVILWAGGDLINGYIHEELQENNYSGPTEACLFVQDQLATGIDFIRRETKIPNFVFLGNHGNHGRSTQKKRISTDWKSSWEWLAYNNVVHYFQKDKSFQYEIARGPHLIRDIQGHKIRFHHGDMISSSGGIGGIHPPLRRKIAQWNGIHQPAELDILGHFHQFADGYYYVLCGCLVGRNAYAVKIGADIQPPSQTMIVIDREHAKVMTLPIFCGG